MASVVDQIPFNEYTGNGVATLYPYEFELPSAADLIVTIDGVVVPPSDFTLAGVGVQAGGSVTFDIAPANLTNVLLKRVIDPERDTDYQYSGDFITETVNRDFNRLWWALQGQVAAIAGSVRAPYPVAFDELPDPSDYAGYFIGLDSSGQPTYMVPETGSAAALASDLARIDDTTRGAGMVGHGNLDYPPATEGYQTPWVVYRALGSAQSDTTGLQAAINTGKHVLIVGNCLAQGLTQSTIYQQFVFIGAADITKNANGPIITLDGDNVRITQGLFRGASASFTGHNVVSTGDNFLLDKCASRDAAGRAVLATGNHVQILGTCDIYHTADSTATGYDIELGVSGTATLYHSITDIYTSQSDGGILLTDTGSAKISGSQIGKLTIANGTGPAGVNGGIYVGNRILGDAAVGVSSSVFTGNQFSVVAITFAGGTSGHSFDETNVIAVGGTVTDSSTNSNVVDGRLIPMASYVPVWTGAGSNPVIGNGTIVGYVTRRGRSVMVSVSIVMGSTTTYGTGAWYVSLPYIPSTSIGFYGSAHLVDSGTVIRVGTVVSLSDGTARCQFYGDSDTAVVDSGRPFTWAVGDTLAFSLTYITAS